MDRSGRFFLGKKLNVGILSTSFADFYLMADFAGLISRYCNKSTHQITFIARESARSVDLRTLHKLTENAKIQVETLALKMPSNGCSSVALGMAFWAIEEDLRTIFSRLDYLFVLGDRGEALVISALAVSYHVKLIHLHGGEKTEGSLDDKYRFAISMLADCHLVKDTECAQRLKASGVSDEKIYVTGSIGTQALSLWLRSGEKRRKELGLMPEEKHIFACLHPDIVAGEQGYDHYFEFMEYLLSHGNYRIFASAPGFETESGGIVERWERLAKKYPEKIDYKPSFGREKFNLINYFSDAYCGNSSAGVLEIPYLTKGPIIDVGFRQKGRYDPVNSRIINCEFNSDRLRQIFETSVTIPKRIERCVLPTTQFSRFIKEHFL